VELRIYNILGQPVRTLLATELAAGVYESLWEGDDESGRKVSSGTYFYQLWTKGFVQSKKMLLVK
jgi:flagellar hook assembly protein FlgD